jgi:lysophospholipase L1-like esterase
MAVVTEATSERRKPRSKRHFVLCCLVGVVIALCLLGLVELTLRFIVPAAPIDPLDPYVSFAGLAPLFVLDETGSRYETNQERLAAFRPQSFSARKGTGTFRIFCLGGSTVQGRPYSVETSFTTWLALTLRAAQPEREFEVVNCGGISYASYRLVPIMDELLEREPDLFILYTGHNEFLEDRTYGRLKTMPRGLSRIQRIALNLRSYALLHEFVAGGRGGQPDVDDSARAALPAEVETRLDFEDGLESYHRDDAWRQVTIQNFHHNLERMVRVAGQAGVPVIVMNPVSNLKDCAPFKSEFGPGLSESLRQRVDELWKKASDLDEADTYGKIQLLEQAIAIDSRHADLLYHLGRCYARLGRFTVAKKWFDRAKEEDVCPLRIINPMHESIRDVAQKYNLPMVDVKALFEARSVGGSPGGLLLLDHVHPSISGHQLIADELFQVLVDMKLADAPEGWTIARDELWRQHLSSLDEAYYFRGVSRLKRLEEWSRGRISR